MNQNKKGNNPKRNTLQIYDSTIPYSPGVPLTTLQVSANVRKFTTSGASSIALSIPIDNSNITNFSRFTVYDEYRVTKVKFMIYPCRTDVSGSTCVWVEPQSSTVPNSTAAQTNSVVQFSNSSATKVTTLTYVPTNFNYLTFVSTAATATVGYLNVYTNQSEFAAPPSTDIFTMRAIYTIQFRGFG